MFEEDNEEGFLVHVASEHNVLDYLSFLLHLEVTDTFDYTPAEKYVANKLANEDGDACFDWFPMRQAMSLQRKDGESELMSSFSDVSSKLAVLEKDISQLDGKFGTLETAMNSRLDSHVDSILRKLETLEGRSQAASAPAVPVPVAHPPARQLSVLTHPASPELWPPPLTP